MPIEIPRIDDRNYQQFLNEARARIPVHNPEWTNFNESDPGITLLQLFAFMTETLLYRSNRIPERNRLKFLKLLNIPLQAASSARGLVVFGNPRGLLKDVKNVPAETELLAGKMPFRTRDAVDVLPVEGMACYKSPLPPEREQEIQDLYDALYPTEAGKKWAFYETQQFQAPTGGAPLPTLDLSDTVDGSLWIALLARPRETPEAVRNEIGSKILSLGILPALTGTSRVLLPGNRTVSEGQPTLIYQIPKLPEGRRLPLDEDRRVAQYVPLKVKESSPGDRLAEPGVVKLELPGAEGLRLWEDLEPTEQGRGDFPPSLEDTALAERVVTWIRIQLGVQSSAGATLAGAELKQRLMGQRKAMISWAGINAANVEQRAHVPSEILGRGTGEPDQTVTLVNKPVIPGSVSLVVNGARWAELREDEDLLATAPEVPVEDVRATPGAAIGAANQAQSEVFKLNRESGEISFGSGQHGKRPPNAAVIQAAYDYGGGRQGNVGIGAISKLSPPPGADLTGIVATNPVPAWGGDEAETVAEAERRIPAYLRHRDRLVSRQDFEEVTWRTPGVDLGRVEIVPIFHPEHPDVPAEGVVTVMVIPRFDLLHPEAPEPDALFLDAVCRHLDPRRLVTTELHVRGPEYVDVWVSVGLEVVPGAQFSTVREQVKQNLREFLSPLRGGFEEKGWPLHKAVEALELSAVAARVAGVAKVEQVILGGATGAPQPQIPLSGLQLPRVAGIEVQSPAPMPLADLRGDERPPRPAGEDQIVPVPVIPPEC